MDGREREGVERVHSEVGKTVAHCNLQRLHDEKQGRKQGRGDEADGIDQKQTGSTNQ